MVEEINVSSHSCAGDLSGEEGLFSISLADFEEGILPTLQSSDCVIVCTHGNSSTSSPGGETPRLDATSSTDGETSRLDATTEK